jgi:tetratricopeptide (TPR) repeat protein
VTQQAVALARAGGAQGTEASALRLLGEIASQSASSEAAEDCYRQALAIAGELGMRVVVAQCHAGLGRLLRRVGERARAEEHLTASTTMFREMNMPTAAGTEDASGAL